MMDDERTSIVKVVLDFVKDSNISRLFQLTAWGFTTYFLYMMITDIGRAEHLYAVIFDRPAILEKKLFIPGEEDAKLVPIICLELYCIPFKNGVTEEINRLRLEEETEKVKP